jgi:peptidoglycan/xylan/chitin deacetylase (PgdA/CDA1 family)
VRDSSGACGGIGICCPQRGLGPVPPLTPASLDTNDYKDGAHNAWLTPDNFASYLIGAFDELYREGLAGSPKMFSIGLHCRLIGRPGRLAGLRKFLEHTRKYEGVWFATREEIADHWKETYPYETVGSA